MIESYEAALLSASLFQAEESFELNPESLEDEPNQTRPAVYLKRILKSYKQSGQQKAQRQSPGGCV